MTNDEKERLKKLAENLEDGVKKWSDLSNEELSNVLEAMRSLRKSFEKTDIYLQEYNDVTNEKLGEMTNLYRNWEKNMDEASAQQKNIKDKLEEINELEKKATENFKQWESVLKNSTDEQQKAAYEQNRYQMALIKYMKAQAVAQEMLSKIKTEEAKNATRDEYKTARSRVRRAKLQDETETEDGRTKANKEIGEIRNKWREFKQENSVGRIAGTFFDKGFNGAADGFNNFMNKDKVSISDVGNKAADIAGNFGPWGKAIGGFIKVIAAVIEQYDKINKASSDYARKVGGGVAKMHDMKKLSTKIADDLSTWGGKVYKFDKILEHTAELSEKTGRIMDHMSEMDFKSLEDLNEWGISSDILNQYDTFGLSVESIDKKIDSIYQTSGRHGLNAKAVTDQVTKNLKMAQQFTFQGGLRALERMAQKATALKIDMSAANSFAEKVSTLEGAAKAGASLSVLGGNWAKMSNPLDLLYGGIQDEETLFDRMLEMTKGSVSWDKQKGQLDMSAFNKMQMKAAAEAMGIDFSSLWTQAMSQGRRSVVDKQLGGNNKLDEDTKEYIRNIAQLEKDENGNARAYVSFTDNNGEEVSKKYLDELNDSDKKALQQESIKNGQGEDKVGGILSQTRTLTDKLNDILDTMKTGIMNLLLKIADVSNEDYAKIMGINDNNAEYFDDLMDNFHDGTLSKARLQGLNLNEEQISDILNKKIDEVTFKNLMISSLQENQSKGLTKVVMNSTKKSMQDGGWYNYDKKIVYEGSDDFKNARKNADGVIGVGSYGRVIGPGGSKQDLIPSMLSPYETVLPADISKKHASEIHGWFGGNNNANKFANGRDVFNALNVLPFAGGYFNRAGSTLDNGSGKNMNIPPIEVNFSGKIDLMSNSNSIGTILLSEMKKDSRLSKAITEEIKKALNNNIYVKTNMADSAN